MRSFELADRQQRQVLSDLVGDLLLRPVVFVDCWHGGLRRVGREN